MRLLRLPLFFFALTVSLQLLPNPILSQKYAGIEGIVFVAWPPAGSLQFEQPRVLEQIHCVEGFCLHRGPECVLTVLLLKGHSSRCFIRVHAAVFAVASFPVPML